MSDIEPMSDHDVLTTLRERGLVEPLGDGVGREEEVKQDSSADVAEGNVLFLAKAIGIQSLLTQFAHPQVRAHFLNQRFALPASQKLLQKLDELRWTLFPRWHGGSLDSTVNLHARSAEHLNSLILQHQQPFVLTDDTENQSMSYKQWYSTLQAIALDDYWSKVPPADRCTHVPQLATCKEETYNVSPAASRRHNSCHTELSVREKKNHSRSFRQSAVKNVEEVIVLSSDYTDSGSESADSNSQSSSSDDYTPPKTRRFKKTREDRREIVVPPMFEMNGPITLKDYLPLYENYFDKKFNGTDYDKTQELSKFLTDEILDVYKIRSGRKLKYNDMKKQLLEWYKKQKVGGKSHWRSELKKAVPNLNEAFDIYGMRLIELARLAYPNSVSDSARELRNQFLSTIPTLISDKIYDAERVIRADGNYKTKRITFNKMVDMARTIQKQQGTTGGNKVLFTNNRPQQYPTHQRNWTPSNFNASTQPQVPEQHNNDKHCTTYRSKSNQRYLSNSQDSDYGPSQNKLHCSYCKKKNHLQKNCWRASKSCLICGKDHHIESCPKYDPNYQSRGQLSTTQQKTLN
jgi:hypothetical protein